jgi:hypothetical protein
LLALPIAADSFAEHLPISRLEVGGNPSPAGSSPDIRVAGGAAHAIWRFGRNQISLIALLRQAAATAGLGTPPCERKRVDLSLTPLLRELCFGKSPGLGCHWC